MKTIVKSIFLLGLISGIASCTTQKSDNRTHSLIVYYSVSGSTQKVAEIIKGKTGADIAEIKCVNPYENDFQKIVEEFQKEMAAGETRDIKPLEADVASYDTIYLGFPVWFGRYAGPVETFLKTTDLKQKTVIPFCTFGSGGNTAVDMLAEKLPESHILPWYGIRADRISKAEKEIESYLAGLDIIPGTKIKLPEFSEQRSLTAEEDTIFQKACGSYPMPLGKPVSVASRKLEGSVEYLYVCNIENQEGQSTVQKIDVTCPDDKGSSPEFIMAYR